MLTTAATFLLQPISAESATGLRRNAHLVVVADSRPGYPCRVCLRDAAVGDEMLLGSYDPFTRPTPYRSPGPVYIHRHPCERPEDLTAIPEQLRIRQLSVRAYDADEMLIAAELTDGRSVEDTIDRLFQDPAAERLHVHSAAPGCFAVSVVRAAR